MIDGFNQAAKKALELLPELTCYTVKNAYDEKVCVWCVCVCVCGVCVRAGAIPHTHHCLSDFLLFLLGGRASHQALHC